MYENIEAKWYDAKDQQPPAGKHVLAMTKKGHLVDAWMMESGEWSGETPAKWKFYSTNKTRAEQLEKAKSILQEAIEIRQGNRQSDYGDAVQNFKRIAEMASAITGKLLTPEDCCAVQIAVKLCREAFHHKRDNLVDLCGYADIMQLIKDDVDG